MKRIAQIAIILAALFRPSAYKAETIVATSCSEQDVQDAITSVSDGGTVSVPAGSCTWSGTYGTANIGIEISGKGLTLTGAGSASTIITDGTPTNSCAVRVTASTGKFIRITGFKFIVGAGGSGSACDNSNALMFFTGVSENGLRVDNNIFDHRTGIAKRLMRSGNISDYITGVFDDNYVYMGNGSANGRIDWFGGGYGSGTYGHVAWTEACQWGNTTPQKFFYIENNTFDSIDDPGSSSPILDNESGVRMAVRFNTMLEASGGMAEHGTESGAPMRAPRCMENYANYYDNNNGPFQSMGTHRGGGFMAWGNRARNYSDLWGVVNNRSGASFGNTGTNPCIYCSSDGSNPLDLNDGTVYASGTHTGANNATTLTDSSKSWTTNEWRDGGYSVRNCRAQSEANCVPSNSLYNNKTTGDEGSWVYSNTATTITYSTAAGNEAVDFDTGDNYVILRTTKVFDAVGRGAGGLLDTSGGGMPSCGAGCSGGYINQADEPSYHWANLRCLNTGCTPALDTTMDIASESGGVYSNIDNGTSPHILNNRDIYQHNSSFTGATGTGYGTLAARPATCTTGVGYWAYDQGSWNSSAQTYYDPDGSTQRSQGLFYKCTATDTWTLYYTPYAYPHPLIAGVSISSVSPAFGQQGAAVAVTLTGLGFQGGNATINAISGITISGTSVVSDTSITATFTIAGGATLGDRNVTVTTDEGTSNAVTFEVLASGSVPTITAISPSSEDRGETASVTLTGTNFTGGTVSLSGTGVTTDNCKVVSATTITCDFIVAASTGWGLREVTVTNGSGTSNTANFFVSSPGIGPGLMRAR